MLRQLTASDGVAFSELRLSGLRLEPNCFRFDESDDFARDATVVCDRLNKSYVVGAFSDGRLAACGGIEQYIGKKLCHKWLVWGMYTHLEHRGKGLGKGILRSLLEYARSKGGLSAQLTVAAPNSVAVGLYSACGFEIFGIERNSFAFQTGFVDELLMRCDL